MVSDKEPMDGLYPVEMCVGDVLPSLVYQPLQVSLSSTLNGRGLPSQTET